MERFSEIISQAEEIASIAAKEVLGADFDNESYQRTAEWREARRGRFTGSQINNLMSCSARSKSMGWNDIDKIIDFGAAAEKYIYNVAMQRKTGVIDMEIYAKSLDYGKENEPALIQQLIDDGVIESHEEVPFITFKNMDYAGASPDGKVIVKGELMGYEGKCTTTWDGHYARRGKPIDDKHKDFWQFTAEMVALRVKKIFYATSYPGVTNQYDYSIIEFSPVHAKAMLLRCDIANKVVEHFIKNGGYIKDSLEIIISEYQF